MPIGLKLLSVITSIIMLFVLLGGALVTKTDSGQGCGSSWPLCHGELIPSNIDTALIIELSHRIVSGISIIVVVWLSIWCWKRIGHIRETKLLAILSVIFLILQALLGAGAVVWGQAPLIMALHFGISLISFATVFLLTLLIFEVDKKMNADQIIFPKPIRIEIIALAIYSYFVIYTGALVRHEDATLVCLDFPFCNNHYNLLPRTYYEWVQMGHRFAAIIFFIWFLIFTIKVLRNYKADKVLYGSSIAIFLLLCVQILSGILTVYLMGNLYMALLHALSISLIFAVFSYLLVLVSRSKKNEATQS